MRSLGKCAGPVFALIVTIVGISHGVVFGARWNEISAGLPSAGVRVNGLTIDPATPTSLYVRALGGGLFRSTDGGGSWQPISSVTGVTTLAIGPPSSSTNYAGTTQSFTPGPRGSTDALTAILSCSRAPMAARTGRTASPRPAAGVCSVTSVA
jgi:hypothetical protein